MARFAYAFSSRKKEDAKDEFVRVLHLISSRFEKLTGPEAVHDVRTLIKLLRALLWLARPSLPPALFDSAKKRLRQAAQMLAGARDAKVVKSTLENLQKEARQADERKAVEIVLERLAEKNGGSQSHLKEAVGLVQKTIGELEQGVASEWKSPARRLRKAYRQTGRAREAARKSGRAASYHEWRKKAKRLLFLLQILESGKKANRTIERVDKMQQRLGDYHDSVVLEEKLKKKFRSAKAEVEPVLRMLKARERRLRKKAGKIAEKI
jgi:CHAD domain-containing protein